MQMVGYEHHVALEKVVNTFLAKHCRDFEHGASGHLCLMDAETGAILSLALYGEIDTERALRTQEYVVEKCRRLRENLERGHMTSWQSRNPDQNQYGGAILAGNMIIAFSNLPEAWDHALVSYVAVCHNWLSEEEVFALAELTDNGSVRAAVQQTFTR